MTEDRFFYLFEQHFSKKASNSEIEEFMHYIDSGNFDERLKVQIDQYYEKFQPNHSPFSLAIEKRILNKVLHKKSIHKSPEVLGRRKLWTYISVAASIVLCLGIAFYLNKISTYKNGQELAARLIVSGSNKARLVLGNGKVILLDTLKNGMQAFEDGVEVTKTKDGQMIYNVTGTDPKKAGQTNTIETPRGGQYQVALPDGTRVWLNAATTLKYSNVFKEKKREVVLSGEAYFEVTHRENQPFIVHTDKQIVEVLGTHFNVNAYKENETQVTTLLEGRVKTSSKSNALVLKPGEQSVLNLKNNQLTMNEADLESIMAWKNGDFLFKDEDLASVMNKVERWYDVEVVFQDVDPNSFKLGGWVSRGKNISAVIKIIESIADVHIKIDGRRLTVMK